MYITKTKAISPQKTYDESFLGGEITFHGISFDWVNNIWIKKYISN